MIEQESFLFLFTTFYVKSDILNWRYHKNQEMLQVLIWKWALPNLNYNPIWYLSLLYSFLYIFSPVTFNFYFFALALNKMIDNTGWMSKKSFKKFYFLKGTVLYLRFQGSTKLRNWQFMLYLYALMHISSPRLPFPQ